MKKKCNLLRAVCCIICAACLFCAVPLGAFAAGELTVVRVGFFSFDGYHMQSADGTRSGYGVELLQHIAGYAGFRYEYIGYNKSWSEMQDMLENGEIDLLTSAQKTEERLERFDFSETSIGTSAAILTVKAGSTKYEPEAYADWNGMRIGMLNDNSRNDGLAEYARKYGFTYTPVYYDNTDQMIIDMKTKDNIDAILTSNLRRIEGERILAQFDFSPFYIIVKKGNTELLDKVNRALIQMDAYETGFRTKLMNKYYPTSGASGIMFSADERSYIEAMSGKTLSAIINPDRAPYSYLKNGELTGSMYDAAQEIIARTGLDIRFTEVSSRDDYWQHVRNGSFDIRFDANTDYNQAERTDCWLTPTYINLPVSRLYLENAAKFDSVIIPENSDIMYRLGDVIDQSQVSVTTCNSVSAAAAAVLNGKQAMALLPVNTATLAVRDDVTNRLVSEIIYGATISYSVAVSNRQSPLLYSIIKNASPA